MLGSRILPIMMMVGAVNCTVNGRPILLSVTMDVTAPHGYVAAPPSAFQTPSGTRFHGSVCRKSWMAPPTRIRLDRVSESGAILASTSRPLFGLEGRNSTCAFYDVVTDWVLAAGERISVCATRTATPCARQRVYHRFGVSALQLVTPPLFATGRDAKLSGDHSRTVRSLSALVMTLTEDSAMAAAAIAGESSWPVTG
jgi:hypothetical protein